MGSCKYIGLYLKGKLKVCSRYTKGVFKVCIYIYIYTLNSILKAE